MSEILIDPEKLQEEIAGFREATEVIDSSPYSIEKGNLDLAAINKYVDSLDQMNTAITSFKALATNDIQNLEFIQADWMNVDRDLAGMTIWDRAFDSSGS
ncbi:DUF5344 family protein [Desemzia sp. RIT804]|uniref:DUF5344 family protein n=1 Tax=Desemzia sp. RIT 804 TaxID=2810209 RepID=UPI001951B352|nr:DUF5344 family protein [Desemzia sp. RIT 804]MBM6614783.1 DUF5344 family protein [Desemzia sp. RIT 804]